MSKDLFGVDIQLTRMSSHIAVGELYFNVKKLQDRLQIESNGAGERRLEGYEKIRTVGKGMAGKGCVSRLCKWI
jgi:hypothetical protein